MKTFRYYKLLTFLYASFSFLAIPVSAQIESERGAILGKPGGSAVVVDIDKELVSFLSAPPNIMREGPLQFAVPYTTMISPSGHGEITEDDEYKIWRVAIHSPGAKSLSVIFEPFRLPEGAMLYLYNEEMSTVRGAYTSKNNNPSNVLPVLAISGDMIIVEYHVPADTEWSESLAIAQVNHDFLGIAGDPESKDGRFGTSQPCNVDVACRENDQISRVRRSVCRIIVNGTTLCSGVLLNTTDLNRPPLVLTAEHCIGNQPEADRTLFVFNYESPWCDGPDGYVSHSMTGSDLLKSDIRLDYTLVRLRQDPPMIFRPYYAGWDATNRVPAKTYTIHHPSADVKKITSDNNPPETGSFLSFETNAFWRIVQWDEGSTEGGSSGAPLFTPDGLVTGILSGGSSVCGSPYNDYFLKINSAFVKNPFEINSFRSLVDPKGIGFTIIEGRDPYVSNISSIDTLSNFITLPHDGLMTLSPPDFGYTTGYSSDSITGFGEFFDNDRTLYVLGALLIAGKVSYLLNTDSVTVRVYGRTGGKPGTILATKRFALNSARENLPLNLVFNTAIPVNAGFYIGWSIPYTAPVFPAYRQFAVTHSPDMIDPAMNKAWFLKNNVWDDFLHHPSMPGAFSLNVKAIVAEDIVMTGISRGSDFHSEMKIYPNPAKDYVYITVGGLSDDIQVSIVDITGKPRYSEHYNHEGTPHSIPVGNLSPGIYIINLEAYGRSSSGKLIIERR
ncbi:MAG: T9SS type A sorting domain-containing protein [Bacteroidales bacterium]|nr:T9SS type A sorting domain-containing protein [Bacteroidales bacterium]